MQNEEQVFDFLAAAEETGRQLDEMTKRLPGEMKAVLMEEWRKSPWFTELPKAAERAKDATNQMEMVTQFLNRTVKITGLVICLASVVIPLATWGMAYWNVSALRKERAALESDKETLFATVSLLKSETGDGVILQKYGDGARGVILPSDYAFSHVGKGDSGREVVVYKWRNP